MVEKELVEVGDRVPVEKFHVSPFNVRAEEPFGEVEEDQRLAAQLRRACMHASRLHEAMRIILEYHRNRR